MAQNKTLTLYHHRFKPEDSLYSDSSLFKKKRIHNGWRHPFLSYTCYINGKIEGERYNARIEFRNLKDQLKLENLNNLDKTAIQSEQDKHEDLFYSTVNSLYYLRMANRHRPFDAFSQLEAIYIARIEKIKENFEQAISSKEKRQSLENNNWTTIQNDQRTLKETAVYAANHYYQVATRSLSNLYSSSNIMVRTGAVYAEKNARVTRQGVEYLPKAISKIPIHSNLVLLSTSSLSALSKDFSNLPRKPAKSALKIGFGLSFSAIPIISGILILNWPTALIIIAACSLYLIGREAGRATGHLYDYHKTGHTHSKKYLLPEPRIKKLENEFHLNRLQTEALRTHIASQMLYAKKQHTRLFDRGYTGFFKGAVHNFTDIVFSRYRHSSAQAFWKRAMRILQSSDDQNEINSVIEIYNQTKPNYISEIKLNQSLEQSQTVYEQALLSKQP